MRTLILLCCACTVSAAEQRVRYWVEECTDASSGCRASDAELAGWAMSAWQAASDGALQFERVDRRDRSDIRVLWAGVSRGNYGEARGVMENGRRVVEVYVRPAIVPPQEKDQLLRDAIVYLTCLHESGHALGLPHTAEFDDIMYSFQYGGDITEYFARYRRKLRTRADISKNSGMSDADRKRFQELYPADTPTNFRSKKPG